MSSWSGGGEIKLIPEEKDVNQEAMDYGHNEYCFKVPKVKLIANYEDYNRQIYFSWADDSVELRRENEAIVYTKSYFTELLAKMNSGEEVWCDGRTAEYSDTLDGEYLNKVRDGVEYSATVYNLNTMEKSIYIGALKETRPMSDYEKAKYGEIKKSNKSKDKSTLINIIINDNNKYCDLDEELKNDIEFNKDLIKKSYSLGYFNFFNDNIRNSEEIIDLALSKSGDVLEFLPIEYKSNKEIVMNALNKSPDAIKFVSDELKKDKDIAQVICKSPNALKYMDKSIFEDKEFIKKIITINPSVLNILDDKYKDDKEIVLLFIKYLGHYGEPLRCVSVRLQDDIDVVKKAVINNGISLRNASSRLQDNKEIVMEAIRSDGNSLRYASDRLKRDKDIIDYIIEHSINSLNIIEDKELIMSLLKEDKSLFNKINYRLQQDDDIINYMGLPHYVIGFIKKGVF